MDRFDGKVVLVTGAASGIGRATVERFAAEGACVLVADIDLEGASASVEQAVAAGAEPSRVAARQVDVTEPDQVSAMVADAVERWGRLDFAVNNAGISGRPAPLPEQRLDDWNRMLAVNLTSVFLCLQAEVPAMLDSGGGSIVNTSSAAGLIGFASLPGYVASKHGVVGLTKSVALEYARQGIRVNAVCPATVRTAMLEAFAGSTEAVERMGALAPIGRVGEPPEIAEAIVWLCSDAASFVTGHALPVDGGVLAT